MRDSRCTLTDCPDDCHERTTCPDAGTTHHLLCGMCPVHNVPRHDCYCPTAPYTVRG
jgi:hypothetical protein